MIKQVIGGLLAAAALLPMAVQAQRRDRGDDGSPSVEQPRGADDRPAQARERAERPRFEAVGDGSGWQGRRDGGDGGRFRGGDRGDAPSVQQPQPRFDGQRRPDAQPDAPRVDRYRNRAPSVDQAQAGGDFRRDWRRQQDGRADVPRTDLYRDREPDRGQVLGGSRFDDRSRIDTRSRIDPRSRFDDRTNYDNRRTPGRAYDNGGYRDRSVFDRGYGVSNGRWNRDWRRDDRYNWNSYRSSNRNAYRLPRYYAPYGWNGGYRRFSIGLTLSSSLWGQDYWIEDPYSYRLPDAYGPYRWVRYYNDALLVDLRSGQVVDTVYDIFN